MEKLFEFLFGDLIKRLVEQFLGDNLAQKVEEVVGERFSSFEDTLSEMDDKVSEMQVALEAFIDDEVGGGVIEPEPVDDFLILADGYPNFRRIAQEDWARTVNGNLVGFVRIKEKYAMMIDAGSKVLDFYTNSDLRGSNDVVASRIMMPAGAWMMVWAKGDTYHDIINKEVRPYTMDGGRLAYIAMKEQNIDGIQLDMDLPEYSYATPSNPKLYIPNDMIDDVFLQSKDIDWTKA